MGDIEILVLKFIVLNSLFILLFIIEDEIDGGEDL